MFIIYDSHHKENQSVIENKLKLYPRRRDYFGRAPRNGPLLNVFQVLATALNRSLVSIQSANELKVNISKYPRLVPGLYISERYEETIEYFIKKSSDKPQFVPPYSIAYNFAYCHTPRDKHASVFNFSVFTNSFDLWTWLTTLLIGYAVCLLVGKGKIQNSWLAIFSTFLAYGPCNLSPNLKYSYLLTLWMHTSTIINNIYSGSITSELIIPAPDDKIDTVIDLKARNYRMIFSEKHGIDRFRDFVESQGNSSIFSAVLEHYSKTATEVDNLHSTLATQKHTATMRSWRNALTAALEATRILKLENKDKTRKCYVGKELIESPRLYFYGFYPADNSKMFKKFQAIMEVGIYKYWYDELHGLLIASKVQERVKVKGSQLDTKEDQSLPKALEIEENISRLFCLWSVCIVACSFVFIGELAVFKCNSLDKYYYKRVLKVFSRKFSI